MTDSMFVFKMRAVDRPRDSYYETRWDRATPVEVVAETKQAAINKAEAMLGNAGQGRYWVFHIDSVRDAMVASEVVS
jgi:hypothetical protein